MADILQPLYARLRDALRADILQGRLQIHDKLPSEHQLGEAHGVSRITVRQALGDLEREGLITRLQGKGAYVSAPRTSQSLQRLQGMTEALTSQGQVVHNQRLSMKPVRATAQVSRQLALSPGEKVYRLMTLRYVDRKAVSVNCSYYPLPLGERMVRLDLSGRDVIDVLEHDLGLRVTQAQLEITAVPMPLREARWLKDLEGRPALRVHRLLLDDRQRPLQIETALHRAEDFSYKLTTHR